MLNKIQTIAQLEKEKEKLRETMNFTRDALAKSLKNNRSLTSRFLIENIAVPGGVLGIGAILAKKLLKPDKQNKQKTKHGKSRFSWLYKQIFPFAMNMFQTFLIKMAADTLANKKNENLDEDPIDKEKAMEETM